MTPLDSKVLLQAHADALAALWVAADEDAKAAPRLSARYSEAMTRRAAFAEAYSTLVALQEQLGDDFILAELARWRASTTRRHQVGGRSGVPG